MYTTLDFHDWYHSDDKRAWYRRKGLDWYRGNMLDWYQVIALYKGKCLYWYQARRFGVTVGDLKTGTRNYWIALIHRNMIGNYTREWYNEKILVSE